VSHDAALDRADRTDRVRYRADGPGYRHVDITARRDDGAGRPKHQRYRPSDRDVDLAGRSDWADQPDRWTRRRRSGAAWEHRHNRLYGAKRGRHRMSTALIADRYRLESRLGSGGMSTVHLAFDERLERLVAVKLLAEHLADDPAFVSRFQREALSAARLIHENIVQVFDSGLDEDTDQHFIVMEYIEGQSCAEILRARGWLPSDETLPIVLAACAGLDYAHRKGVVHRDVKPGNILRASDHRVKLADFGIAKATEQSSITQVGSVLGTAAYLAPEQGRGEEAGPPADIYALGVVTYQILSGRLPFEGKSLTELALKQQQGRPAPLDTLVAGVSPELASAVAVALRIEPQLRYPTAVEMGRALADGAKGIAPGSGSAIVPPLPGAGPVTTVSSGKDETRVVRAVPREPRQGPPRREPARVTPNRNPAGGRQPAPQRPASPPNETTRLIAVLAGIIAVVVIAVVIILSFGGGADNTLRLQPGFSSNAPNAIDQMQNLVDNNQQ
jgi:eukaryotic-like serine/threonine-protein kinase